MPSQKKIRDIVLRSLTAIGAEREANFYLEQFTQQSPEAFALIVIDPRCLNNPLLEALVTNIRILSDLGLTPVLLIGALDKDRTKIKFQAQRLFKELETLQVRVTKLNTATYQLIDEVKKYAKKGHVPLLEFTHIKKAMDLETIIKQLNPGKVIFLQPSGGIALEGERVSVINIDNPDARLTDKQLSPGQLSFKEVVTKMLNEPENRSIYIMASPLNLLRELFTTKGSGTLMRRGAPLLVMDDLIGLDKDRLITTINDAFGKPLNKGYLDKPILSAIIERDYRGGAIMTDLGGMPYLSKFWVSHSARGEGIARDIWDAMTVHNPRFFWRSRMDNGFNDWYMQACDGMQIVGDWRVFWRGLESVDIPLAVELATQAPQDFKSS